MLGKYSPLTAALFIGLILSTQTLTGMALHFVGFILLVFSMCFAFGSVCAAIISFFKFSESIENKALGELYKSYKKTKGRSSPCLLWGVGFATFVFFPTAIFLLSFYGMWWSFAFLLIAQIAYIICFFSFKAYRNNMEKFGAKLEESIVDECIGKIIDI